MSRFPWNYVADHTSSGLGKSQMSEVQLEKLKSRGTHPTKSSYEISGLHRSREAESAVIREFRTRDESV
jgi:hypothetical protein